MSAPNLVGVESHEVACIFPMMGEDEFRDLVVDIEANGLREPIWIYQDKIIDGRNRYRACLEAGIEPRFQEWNGKGSPVDFVVSLNLKRRHLTSSQKAMVALEIERQLAIEAKQRQGTRTDIVEKILQCEPGRASIQAASIVGTNQHYVTDAKKIVEQAPELKEALLNGSLTIPEAKRQLGAPAALLSSESNEWFTPAEYVEAARELMGGIDIDPASCDLANRTVKASTFYDKNGLNQPWHGRIWLNPPYGFTWDHGPDYGRSNQELWSRKLRERYEIDLTVTEAILLVNSATEAKWFQPLYNYLICFTDHRIRFYNTQGGSSQPTQGNALVYFGKQRKQFIKLFSRFGTVIERARADE